MIPGRDHRVGVVLVAVSAASFGAMAILAKIAYAHGDVAGSARRHARGVPGEDGAKHAPARVSRHARPPALCRLAMPCTLTGMANLTMTTAPGGVAIIVRIIRSLP